MRSEFHLKPHPLQPNHLFMDIHKKKAAEKFAEATQEDHYEKYKRYEEKIGLLFADLPKEHRFWLITGSSISSLKELYKSFDSMSDEVFSHHVRQDRNDFADWVKNIYHDHALAAKLETTTTRRGARRMLEEHIDNILKLEKEPKDEISFFRAVVTKLSSQNKRLEEELAKKREWIERKQRELEDWEKKNIRQDGELGRKYKELEDQEKDLMQKFSSLHSEGDRLRSQLMAEKKEIEEQDAQIRKEREDIARQRKEMRDKEIEQDELTRKMLSKKNSHVYIRLDELMSLVTTCVYNKNYKEARDAMSKVKYYYGILPNADPKKKEFYEKIVRMKKHIDSTLSM